MIAKTLLLMPSAYLLGSIPWGVIVTRLFAQINIQEAGSGNIGAYNVYRLTGTKLALATLAGDILKGAVPVWIGLLWLDQTGWLGELYLSLIALCAFSGHIFSVFLKFKGGKGVATAAGCLLALSPIAFFICLLVYILILCSFGYSSAGSLSASIVLPFVTWPATHSLPITVFTIVVTVSIFARHYDNIIRLLEGKEHTSFR